MVTRGWRDPPWWTRRAGATWAPPTTGDGGGRPAARLASRRPLPPHGRGAKLSRACPSPLPRTQAWSPGPAAGCPATVNPPPRAVGQRRGRSSCASGAGGGEARVFYRPANCPSTSCGVSEVCTSVNYTKPTRVQSLVRTAPAERASRPAPPAPSAPQSRCWAGWGAPLLTWEPRGCSGAGGGAPIALGSKAAVQGRGHDTDRPEQSAEPDG